MTNDTVVECDHNRQWVGPNRDIKLPCANPDCIDGFSPNSIKIKGDGLYIRTLGHYNGDETKWLYGWSLAKD